MQLLTIDQANAMLPLVKAITADLCLLARDLAERRARVRALKRNRNLDSDDYYSEELAQIEEAIEQESEQLNDYIAELHQLGVEPESTVDGLIDFPGQFEGRPVYFCWQLGEPEILFWHGRSESFVDRQPLALLSGTGDEPGDLSSQQ